MKLLPENPPDISARVVRRAWTVVAAVALVMILGTVVGFFWLLGENQELTGKVDASDKERAALSKRVDSEHADAQALKEQVERLGGRPVVDPGEPKQGPPGPAPTEAQVRAAVADYCTGDRCKPVVSRAQVQSAVAAFCANDACRGESTDGKDGTDGANGTNGTDGQTGAQGPGPTDAQIAAAVETYCAANECGKDGADGQDGKDGRDGADGTSVTDVTCDRGTGVFTFTFSDGSTRTVECSPLG